MERDFSNIEIPDSSVVRAEDTLLPLCPMCTKSPLNCENSYIREVELPMEEGDDPSLEVIGDKRMPDGTWLKCLGFGTKLVDGVEAGIYKTEEDVPEPFVCEWFEPKPLG